MAGRFALFTDENIDGPIIQGLRHRGWDVQHAGEEFGEKTKDTPIFEHAAKQERVFVSTDHDILPIAKRWIQEGSALSPDLVGADGDAAHAGPRGPRRFRCSGGEAERLRLPDRIPQAAEVERNETPAAGSRISFVGEQPRPERLRQLYRRALTHATSGGAGGEGAVDKAMSKKTVVMEWIDDRLKADPRLASEVDEILTEMRLEQGLAALRGKRKLTQGQVARLLGTSQPYVAKLESGRVKNLGVGTLVKYARALGATVSIQIKPRRQPAAARHVRLKKAG